MVRVEPVAPEWAQAMLLGDAHFAKKLGVHVETGWLVFPEARRAFVEAAQRDRADPWGLHVFFDDEGALVGIGGWKGPPTEQVAELGYAVAPARRGRGIATSAVRELLSRARGAGLRAVAAHTLAEESASTSVLIRCGFTKTRSFLDPKDGPLWRWECNLDT